MAGLTKIKSDLNPWTVVISGNTWQCPVSKTYTVTNTEMQSDSNFFKALVLIQALYEYELIEYEYMDSNISRIVRELGDILDINWAFDDPIDNECILRNFFYDWVPRGNDCFNWEYPEDAIDISIFDGKGQKYELNYDDNDVIDALKTFKLAK